MFSFYFLRTSSVGGGEANRLPLSMIFSLFSRPRAGLAPCKVVSQVGNRYAECEKQQQQLPRARRHRASSPQGSSSDGCCLCRSPWTIKCAPLFSHTQYVWSARSAEYGLPGNGCQFSRGPLNRKNDFSLSPFAPENLTSRDGFGRPVPPHPTHFPYSG